MKKKTYINNGGSHRLLNGKDVDFGKTVTTDEDLMKKFPNKFSVVYKEDEVESGEGDETTKTEAPVTGTEGVDVTSDFPKATDGELRVMKVDGGFMVYDGDKDAINETPLNKKDTKSFIVDYLSE